MAHFMPDNEDQATNLKARLSKTIFRSPEDFVTIYNSGMVNKRHNDVLSLVKEVKDTYRDVKESNGRLVFISQEEIFIEEMIARLTEWSTLVKIKEEVNAFLKDGALHENDHIAFTSSNIGLLHKEDPTGTWTKLGGDRLFGSPRMAARLHEKYSSLSQVTTGQVLPDIEDATDEEDYEALASQEATAEDQATGEVYPFKVSDFTNLDEGFITTMREALGSN